MPPDRKIGIVIPDSLLSEIERPLEYGDSRSDRIRELLRVGLTAEQALKDTGELPDDMDDRVRLVRESIEASEEET